MYKMPVFPEMQPAQCFEENSKVIFLKNVTTKFLLGFAAQIARKEKLIFSLFLIKKKKL